MTKKSLESYEIGRAANRALFAWGATLTEEQTDWLPDYVEFAFPADETIVYRNYAGIRYGIKYSEENEEVKLQGAPFRVVVNVARVESGDTEEDMKSTEVTEVEVEVVEEVEDAQEETEAVEEAETVDEQDDKSADVQEISWENNELKAVGVSEDGQWLRVKNRILVFGGRDAEGVLSRRVNEDGSKGEFFTKSTAVESPYTMIGRLPVDYEHGLQPDGKSDPGRDDILGYVDWSTKSVDEDGLWVERVLNRQHRYVKMLEKFGLIDAGVVGTSSEPVQRSVRKAENGEIVSWPLFRDSLTFTPMEPRMLSENALTALKAAAEEDEYVAAYAKSIGLIADDEPADSAEGDAAETDVDAKAAREVELARAKARASIETMKFKLTLENN